jgi:RNA polymerase sigma factor (sigma-70 family)
MTMLTDAVLVDRVVAGFEGDFEELYKRHANAAWRVAQAVTGNAHDAADAVAEAFARVFQAVKNGRLTDAAAFRSYLLTATRNASLDTLRRSGKTKPTDSDDLDGLELDALTPSDAVEGAGDAAMIAEAFRNLPERWRSVLWLTEVEGVATKDVADQLGISANGAAQLAVRARAGLRERFLQAHLKGTSDPECRFTVDRLGAYVGGGLSPRDIAKVDQHLAACTPCREKKDELEDLGSSLRRIVLPLPLMLGAVAGKRVAATLIASSHPVATGPTAGARIVAAAKQPKMQRLVAASAAGVFGLGLLAASMTGGVRPKIADLSTPAGAEEAADVQYALDLPTASDLSWDHVAAYRQRVTTASTSTSTGSAPKPLELPRSAPAATPMSTAPKPAAATPPGPAQAPAGAAPADADPTGPLPLPAEPVVAVNVGASAGGTPVGVTATVGSTPDAGVQVADTVVGTAPTVPTTDGVTATVDPIGSDPVTVSLP